MSNMPLRQVRTILILFPFDYFLYILHGYVFHICVPNEISVFLPHIEVINTSVVTHTGEQGWTNSVSICGGNYTHVLLFYSFHYPVYYKVPVLQNWRKAPKHFIKTCPTLEISIIKTRYVLKSSLVNSSRNSYH